MPTISFLIISVFVLVAVLGSGFLAYLTWQEMLSPAARKRQREFDAYLSQVCTSPVAPWDVPAPRM